MPQYHYLSIQKIKIISSTSFPVSSTLSLPTQIIVHFAKRDIVMKTIRHKYMELKLCRKTLCIFTESQNQALSA